MKSMTETLKDQYVAWLRDKIKFKELNGTIEITTPLMDRHNDYFQIYVTQMDDSNFRITDAGYVIGDLELDGIDVLHSPKRKELLQATLNRHGVKLSKSKDLYVEATMNSFAQKKHMLIQAMLTINDMFMVSRSNVSGIFAEEIARFFEEHDIRFTPNISFVGKTGFTHQFDFVIPKSKHEPERIIKSINVIGKQSTSVLLFAWNDTKEMRSNESELFVFINDSLKKASDDSLRAFDQYNVSAIPWSKRNDQLTHLTA